MDVTSKLPEAATAVIGIHPPAGRPPLIRTLAFFCAGAAILALTIWLMIRERDGNEQVRIALEPGDTISVEEPADVQPENTGTDATYVPVAAETPWDKTN